MLPDDSKTTNGGATSANAQVYELVRACYHAREQEGKFHEDALVSARAILPLLGQLSAEEREKLFEKHPTLFMLLAIEWMKGQRSKLFDEFQKVPNQVSQLLNRAAQQLRSKSVFDLFDDALDSVVSLGTKAANRLYHEIVKLGADIVK